MGSMFRWLARFFGFSEGEPSLEERLRQAMGDLGSQIRLDACTQAAYQVVQRQDALIPGQTHPYEATILGDCLRVDSLLTEHYSSQLSRRFGDAQFLVTSLGNGVQTQLQPSSAQSLSATILGQIATSRPEADRLAKELKETRRDLQVFKGANGITTAANYPSSYSNSLYWIGAVAILEAFANAWFLRQQSIPVIAGIIAIAIAALNVGGSVWFGIRYREKNLPDLAASRRGQRYMVMAILFILVLNFGIAGYRLLMQSESAGLTIDFWFESTVLLVIGIALGITAFNKGYALDDPFPGYGDLARKVDSRERTWTDIAQQHADFCEKEKTGALDAHRSLIEELSRLEHDLALLLPEMARMISAWTDERRHLDFSYGQLLTMFRTTLSANHPAGNTYPTQLNLLSPNSQLESYRKQAEALLGSREKEERKNNVQRVVSVIEGSQNTLKTWIQSDEAQLLFRWPN